MVEMTAAVGDGAFLAGLEKTLRHHKDWSTTIDALAPGNVVTVDSVWGSSCALLAAALVEHFAQPVLFVMPTEKGANRLIDDWTVFSKHPATLFPTVDSRHTEDLSADPRFGDRLRLLKCLNSSGDVSPRLIVSSIQALAHKLPAPDALRQRVLELSAGAVIEMDRVASWLTANAFQQVPAVRLPGEFAVRGGLIDVFAPDWESPGRIEWFDREVESIRFFDVETQRSETRCTGLAISGAVSDHAETAHLADYFRQPPVAVLFEPQETESQCRSLAEMHGDEDGYFGFGEIQSRLAQFPVVMAGRLVAKSDQPHFRLPVKLIESFDGDFSDLRRQIDQLAPTGRVVLLTSSDSEANRVSEILKPTRVSQEGRLHFDKGSLNDGFAMEPDGPVILSSDQLFSRTHLERRASRLRGRAIDSFLDLQSGDLIVHLAHGIGRFRGLKVLDKDGQRSEHLELEFHGGTRIYLPATKFGLIQKYSGGTKHRPRLAKIGNRQWQKQKEAVAEAVTDLAADMLRMQAERQAQPGITFAEDTAWQHEFEHSFPFQETPDQLSAIEEIKADMQSPRPMDRLLCGDVGFGKTEVAMRAAFKAVESGYQVAVLVPTTILAEQHYRTFRERMAEFPVDIAKLSRFCTPAEERDVVRKLAEGSLDIVIGTHRLASKDVRIKNLGLIIIDEEQKFGVAHKERLKSLRADVDILTLSATPIPRTLHMSLVGVRDISNLQTAPADRLAVQTRVTQYSDTLIRDAVLRELERGGQIYFVHNRIMDIRIIADNLQRAVPEARIDIGHGQMDEAELELAMTRFIQGETDILIATTIVENGLDIPNANTIFINEADRYGLSDLHQLRGRVGRYHHKAWCYLLIDPRKHLNPTAAKRLHAIEKYSEMGAGFAIAMRDLEIRGAGNLLGTEQSGHIASVGYELYCQLLESAVRELKRLPAPVSVDVEIDLPISAWIPDEYISDNRQKIEIYRRISRMANFDEIAGLRKELRDRFGKLPESVKRLMKLAELRLEATLWQVSHIFMEERYLGLRFRDSSRLEQLVRDSKFPLRAGDDKTAWLTLKSDAVAPEQLIALLKSILQAPASIP